MPNMVHETPRHTILYDNQVLADSADLVALAAGRRIKVLSAVISMASGGTVKFQSGASTDIFSPLTTGSGQLVIVLPYNPMGWFRTVAGEKLNAVLSSAIATTIALTYILE